MNAGLFHLVFWWRANAGSLLPWLFRGRHALSPLQYSSRLLFQQNAGQTFRARPPQDARFGRGRLTEGESRLPFHPLLLKKTEQFACKRRFTSARWEFSLLFSNVDVTLRKNKGNVQPVLPVLGWFTQMVFNFWGAHSSHSSVTGSLCSIFLFFYFIFFKYKGLQKKTRFLRNQPFSCLWFFFLVKNSTLDFSIQSFLVIKAVPNVT